MTDLHALTDAFAELERRADAVTAARQPELPPLTRRSSPAPRRGSRLVPVAATIIVVAGLAVGAALLVPRGNHETQSGAPPTANSSGARTATSSAPAHAIPRSSQELADRFRAVLGDTATFTLTEIKAPKSAPVSAPVTSGKGARHAPAGTSILVSPPDPETAGATIIGKLTASGVTGGFYLSVYRSAPGAKPMCADLDRTTCTMRTLADGSLVAIGEEKTDPPNGILYMVDLIRPDGVQFLMNLSNQADPKGDSQILGAAPPMTTEQMIAVVSSDRW